MKHFYKYTKALSSVLVLSGCLGLTACTDAFDKWNINPNEVTPGEMGQDNLTTGAFFTQMEKGVFIVGVDKGGEYQITEMLAGDIFSGYVSNITTYSYATYHNDHYALYQGWYNAAFNDAYTDIMQPWISIQKEAEKNGTPAVGALADIVKVLGMSRITDMYGPIPYTKFGTTISVPYDSQKDVYYKFFEELDNAINILTAYHTANGTAKVLSKYDYIYSGDVEKWIKFANTLRLRLAMRISYIDGTKAETEATAAINHAIGLMKSADDSAILHQNTNFTFTNPLWEVSQSFKDMRMGASMESYLKGYEDPRLKVYFRPADTDGNYHGARNGINRPNKDSYSPSISGLNFQTNSNMQWMDAAESYFLQAEAKLRWNIGGESTENLYNNGIKTSFSSKGASGADNYIADDTKTPSDYDDPVSYNDAVKTTTTTVAWDESASMEQKLERIMIQKWIAIFPDGQEAWSEIRRTGYPQIFKIVTNQSNGEVASGELIRRLKFPTTEYSNNSSNTTAAVTLLGGKGDTAGTKLWWDAK